MDRESKTIIKCILMETQRELQKSSRPGLNLKLHNAISSMVKGAKEEKSHFNGGKGLHKCGEGLHTRVVKGAQKSLHHFASQFLSY